MKNQSLPDEFGLVKVKPVDRTYTFGDMVWTWFATGINTGSWYFGGVAAALGLSFVLQYSLIWLPIIMIPWAALGYMGHRYGATTVVTTRPSLGIHGSKLTGLAEFIVLIGWPSINSYIAGISLTYIFSSELGWPAYGEEGGTWPLIFGILLTTIVQGIFTIIGHNAIRYLERVAVLLLVILGGWQTYIILTQWDLSKITLYSFEDQGLSFVLYFDLAIAFSWTWAQISDFSRFSKTSKGATIGSWIGINLGQGWFMIVGGLGVIGVALQTGVFNPDNSDPSSVMASLNLGLAAFLVLVLATISTNVTNLYGAGMGLASTFPKRNPRYILIFIAVLQLLLCLVPLVFDTFVEYFQAFISFTGGLFIPLWTVVLVDYFLVRRMNVPEKYLFSDVNADRLSATPLSAWNMRGLVSVGGGLLVYYLLKYLLTDLAAMTTASIPAILISSSVYLVLSPKRFTKVATSEV